MTLVRRTELGPRMSVQRTLVQGTRLAPGRRLVRRTAQHTLVQGRQLAPSTSLGQSRQPELGS